MDSGDATGHRAQRSVEVLGRTSFGECVGVVEAAHHDHSVLDVVVGPVQVDEVEVHVGGERPVHLELGSDRVDPGLSVPVINEGQLDGP